MMRISYAEKVKKLITASESMNLAIDELAFLILQSAEPFGNEEVEIVLKRLPPEVADAIGRLINDYRSTGEYYVVSSTGVTKNLSSLMHRLSTLFS